jgi:uncharacterized membrane protein (UPF0127 family)
LQLEKFPKPLIPLTHLRTFSPESELAISRIMNYTKYKYLLLALPILIAIIVIISIGFSAEKLLVPRNIQPSNLQSSQNIAQLYLPAFEKLELARTSSERAIGYMNRKEICTKCGMLFIFDNPDIQSFWMRNTLVELKIIFLDNNGNIVNIGTGKPNQESPTIRSVSPVKYVLEVPATTEFSFKENQVLDVLKMIELGIEQENGKI